MPITGSYTWFEGDETVTFQIPLKAVSRAKLDVYIAPMIVKVSFPPYLVEVFTFNRTNPDKQSMVIKDGVLQIEVYKEEPVKWGRPDVDIGDNKKLLVEKRKEALQDAAMYEEKRMERKRRLKIDEERFATRAQMAIDSAERELLDDLKAEEKKREQQDMYQALDKLRSQDDETKKKSSSGRACTDMTASSSGYSSANIISRTDLVSMKKNQSEDFEQSSCEKTDPPEENRGAIFGDDDVTCYDSDLENEEINAGKDAKRMAEEEALRAELVKLGEAIENGDENDDDNDDEIRFIPPPRSDESVKVGINFTPRHFPTPMRESQQAQEDDWIAKNRKHLKKHGILKHTKTGDISQDDPTWLKAKADDFFRGGDFLSAINSYSAALDIEPMLPCFSNRAACYLKIGHFDDCVSDCTEAMELLSSAFSPEEAEQMRAVRLKLLLRRGVASCQQGHFKDSVTDHEAALDEILCGAEVNGVDKEKLCSDIGVLRDLVKMEDLKKEADSAFGDGRIAVAADLYTQALDVVEINVSCMSNRAACKMALGDVQGCVEDCSLALKVLEQDAGQPLGSGVYSMLGAVLPCRGSDKRKLWVSKTVLRRGACYAQQKDFANAVADYSLATGLDPKNEALKSDLNKLRNAMQAATSTGSKE